MNRNVLNKIEYKVEKLIEENIFKDIKYKVEDSYDAAVDAVRGKAIQHDMIEPRHDMDQDDFKNEKAIHKDDEIILSPTVQSDEALMKGIPELIKHKRDNIWAQAKAHDKVDEHMDDNIRDVGAMHEKEDILSAMMGKPVRFSKSLYSNTVPESINAKYRSAADQQNNAMQLNKDMAGSDIIEKANINLLHSDKLSPLQRRILFNSNSDAADYESLPFDMI